MTPTPDSTRRPGVAARPVVLADGLPWGFAAPGRRSAPIFSWGADASGCPALNVAVRGRVGHPIRIERLVDDLRLATRGGTAGARCEAFDALAAALLREAHDVDAQTASMLLDVPPADRPRLAGAVLAIALGKGPTDA